MIQARVQQGRIEPHDPIPDSWEGQWVKIETLTPDDLLPDLDKRLAALHRMGAMEFEAGERDQIARELEEVDRISKDDMNRSAGHPQCSVSIALAFD